MKEPLGRRDVPKWRRKGLRLSVYMLLEVETMRNIVLRLYSQAKEGR